MDKLRKYLNGLDKQQRAAFCKACGTSEGYLRKAISTKARLGEGLCINIDRASRAVIRCEDLRPDVDWAYLRSSCLHDRKAGEA